MRFDPIAARRKIQEKKSEYSSNFSATRGKYSCSVGEYYERRYLISVPESGPRMDVIIVLHGGGGRAETAAIQANFEYCAGSDKIIFVYPQGMRNNVWSRSILHWNAGEYYRQQLGLFADDVAFISSVIDDVRSKLPVGRVFVAGFSNGSLMAYRLGCEIPDKLNGIGCLSAARLEDSIQTAPVPLIHIHGDSDTLAPYAGGRGQTGIVPIDHMPVYECVSSWAIGNGCSDRPKVNETSLYTRYEFVGGAKTVLYKVKGLGHGWPGGVQMLPDSVEGDINTGFCASDTLISFFFGFA